MLQKCEKGTQRRMTCVVAKSAKKGRRDARRLNDVRRETTDRQLDERR